MKTSSEGLEYQVQFYHRNKAAWITMHAYDNKEQAIVHFERLIERETDEEREYRVLQTEIVNMVIRAN